MPSPERTPQERETLIFATLQEAQQFRDRVAENLKTPTPAGVTRDREVVAEVVADEFAQAGTPVTTVREPWLHTQAEHEEVQELVDLAFAQDLPAVIKVARQSAHYPRNLDLLHDVLTGELYHLVQEGKLAQQPVSNWLLSAAAILLLVVLAIILLFVV